MPKIRNAVLEKLQAQNAEQKIVLQDMASGWLKESKRLHTETLETIKFIANVQVPFDVQEYLNQFSLALANEVRMLLGEVGKLREEKRDLQYELGCLLCTRSKYGPGGEFDPAWREFILSRHLCAYGYCLRKPVVRPYVRGDGGGPPFPGGPLPPEPVSRLPNPLGAMFIRRPSKLSKRQKRQQAEAEEAAAAGGPSGGPENRTMSWATWQPKPGYAPTPPSQEPELVAPERPMGLFGPRSSNSFAPNIETVHGLI
ncbi:hypothetical protein JB92DRAFT_1980297 [Gautieria morchelliformis]|nr:hypothetical protein JB92DRAFT_1980297 [Gautieria morchelliformis]